VRSVAENESSNEPSPSEALTEQDLIRIEHLARAATIGPWKSFVEGRDHKSGSHSVQTGDEKDIELSAARRSKIKTSSRARGKTCGDSWPSFAYSAPRSRRSRRERADHRLPVVEGRWCTFPIACVRTVVRWFGAAVRESPHFGAESSKILDEKRWRSICARDRSRRSLLQDASVSRARIERERIGFRQSNSSSSMIDVPFFRRRSDLGHLSMPNRGEGDPKREP
jgi:hypothetical protein